MLERHTNLSEIVRTGTPVNSAVNLEVLGTIFYEGTPLHDGAAIIENGRIKAAGCVLPLSNNLDLGKDMGTRHRACLHCRKFRCNCHRGQRGDRHHLHGKERRADPPF